MDGLKKFFSILICIFSATVVVFGIVGLSMNEYAFLEALSMIGIGAFLSVMSYKMLRKSFTTSEATDKPYESHRLKSDKKTDQNSRRTNSRTPIKEKSTEDLLSIQKKSRERYRQSKPAPKPTQSTPKKKSPPPSKKPGPVFKNIFISYRRNDSADVTGRIYDKLLQSFDRKQLFKDVDSIPLGVDFLDHLNKKVGECNVLIAIIGPYWIESNVPKGEKRIDDEKDFVRIEIESALKRKIPVIPVLVRGAKMPSNNNLPESLKTLAFWNGIPVRPDPDFHRDMERLIQGIKHHI